MQYLYTGEHHAYFMDTQSYEQMPIPESLLTDQKAYLKENIICDVLVHEGGVLGVELPNFIEAEIVETDPGFRGDTATGGTKPATIETGAVVQVPLFVNKGEVIRVDTRTNQYLERVT